MKAALALWAAVALAAGACGSGPQPIVAGDPCARCHMPVADARFGAELVTKTGIVRKYDAIECLARDLEESAVAADRVASLWVVPFDAPGTLVPAEQAVYVHSPARRSPMGLDLTAFTRDADLASLGLGDAPVLDWRAVRTLVAGTPVGQRHPHGEARAH